MKKFKVLYFSPPHFLDYDLCLLQELRRRVDIYYVLDISVTSRKANILEYSNPLKKPGIFSFEQYSDHFPQFYIRYINYKSSYFINRISSKSYHTSNLQLQLSILSLIKNFKFILAVKKWQGFFSAFYLGIKNKKFSIEHFF